jgi:hypothetical protein
VTDWTRIEQSLDDRTTAHACAFCGERIPVGDEHRWSLAVRGPSKQTAVVWMHGDCFRMRLHPKVRRSFVGPASDSPPA